MIEIPFPMGSWVEHDEKILQITMEIDEKNSCGHLKSREVLVTFSRD